MGPWGDFEPDDIRQLEEHGINVDFYIARKKAFKQFKFEDLVYAVIHHGPDNTYFVVISRGEKPVLPFEQVKIPTRNLQSLRTELDTLHDRQNKLKTEIRDQAGNLARLKAAMNESINDLEFLNVKGSYELLANERLIAINGWFPMGVEDRLRFVLNKKQVPFSIRSAIKEDRVPVLLKNPKYPRLFESITEIFELPNYREMDLTPFIAVFYPILFAYCLGDAGYGAVLLLAATIAWFTFLKEKRNLALLGIILGSVTLVLGIIKSGSLFGIPLQGSDHPVLQLLSQYIFIPDDNTYLFNAFNVSLMIGVLQILIGIVISIINKVRFEGWNHALSQIGKLLIVSNLIWIFLADMQEMQVLTPLPYLRHGGLYVGIAMVLLFHDLQQGIISRIASGVLPLFFIFTGILGDILSYVRLFALGVASSVLGLVVNQIGEQILGAAWWGIPVGILFLIFGHSLNFGIAVLGSFVHPLRLTFVEFYNNAQFQGGGLAYKPFRKSINETIET
jgi:V/A-type H+-transporting ATPase subunit I